MKSTKQLINNIIGQLGGINEMIDDKKDCQAVLMQMKAARSALGSLMNKYIENNLECCLKSGAIKDRKKFDSIIKEIIKH